MRVALVHDWLTGMRGGEYVLEAIAELFKEPDLFTLIEVPGSVSPRIAELHPRVSGLQRMPGALKRYRHYLPLMPYFAERMDLGAYDLIVSSSHCVAKGVRKRADAVHVSYVHAPMRYVWDRFDDYFGPGRASFPVRLAARAVRGYLQRWDRRVSSPERVDLLIANSRFIGEQIRISYSRDSRVIYPFADVSRFTAPRRPGPKYLMVGAFAPNKRVDLAVQAFNELGLPLVIVGTGQEEARLRQMAGPTIEFLGARTNAEIAELYSTCRAFVFPGLEDFGITPLEAMASGAPVIAYGAGGAMETVTEETGLRFAPQTTEALKAAVLKLERGEVVFNEADCRARAAEFSRERFKRELRDAIRDAWVGRGRNAGELESAFECKR